MPARWLWAADFLAALDRLRALPPPAWAPGRDQPRRLAAPSTATAHTAAGRVRRRHQTTHAAGGSAEALPDRPITAAANTE
jgi:hypothetical protein